MRLFSSFIWGNGSPFFIFFNKPINLNTLCKSERLVSKKLIDQLYFEGKSFYSSHLKITVLLGSFNFSFPAQVLISVSKKSIKNAVNRNAMKRKIRESYRMVKSKLYEVLEINKQEMILSITYKTNSNIDYHNIEIQLIKIINKIHIYIQNYLYPKSKY